MVTYALLPLLVSMCANICVPTVLTIYELGLMPKMLLRYCVRHCERSMVLALALLLLGMHEWGLSSSSGFALADYMMSDAPRDTLISANREGIFSAAGFTSIYWLGVWVKESNL